MTMPETIWASKAGAWDPLDASVLEYQGSHEYVLRSSVQAEINAAVMEPLKIGDVYWVPSPLRETMAAHHRWTDDWDDKRWLRRGLIYLTETDAIARAKAMIGGAE